MSLRGGRLWEASLRIQKTFRDHSPHEDEGESQRMRILQMSEEEDYRERKTKSTSLSKLQDDVALCKDFNSS